MRKMFLLTILIAALAVPAFAYDNSVGYSGQGLIADGFGGYDLNDEICGVANGADVDGPYLLWVLTATKSTAADITGPWGTVEMTKTGNGTFKYVSGWYDPDTLPGNVSATYNGKSKNAQLVISHGCRPYVAGAWCSPGFWKNAQQAAWDLVGVADTQLFDSLFDTTVDPPVLITPSVYPVWFGGSLPNISLRTVLDHANIYSGPPFAGTSGYQLNAFNGTGAFLTNRIPGYQFDWNVMQAGGSDACPIDHHGNFK